MKKILLIFLITISCVTLVGCGSDDKNNNEEPTNTIKDYIDDSKKLSAADIAVAYVTATRTKVNEAKELNFFATDVLYMVPAGDDSSKACIKLDLGGTPIFGDKWNYIYIGVIFNGTGYNYYYIGEDNETVGFPMISSKELNSNAKDYIYKEYSNELSNKKITKEFAEKLAEMYGTSVKERNLTSDEKKAFEKAINDETNANDITKIIYVDYNCKYEIQ